MSCHCEEARRADVGPTSTVGSAERTFRLRSAAIRIPCTAARWGQRALLGSPKGGAKGRRLCPPSCQPVGRHCHARQPGHFLEIASLHPPPAALRRFALSVGCADSSPKGGAKPQGLRHSGGFAMKTYPSSRLSALTPKKEARVRSSISVTKRLPASMRCTVFSAAR